MKNMLVKHPAILLLTLAVQTLAWANPSAQQTDLENTLAQAIATYDPNLSTPAAQDYENNLSIDQSTLMDSNDNYAIGAQLQVNTSSGSIVQDGSQNVAGIFQVAGTADSAIITQAGNYNYAAVTQVGNSNTANISQQNDNNILLLNQQNGNNAASISQLGNTNLTVNQTGNDTANVTVQGTTANPLSITYSQSPGSSWTVHITN